MLLCGLTRLLRGRAVMLGLVRMLRCQALFA